MRAVKARDTRVRKPGREDLGELRREIDFGHQHERLLAAFDRVGDRAEIDLGLAAPGDAIQQRGPVRPGRALRCAQCEKRLFLHRVQRRIASRYGNRTGRGFLRVALGRALQRWQPGDRAVDAVTPRIAQRRGQCRKRDFAERAMVIARREADQFEPVARQRRNAIDHRDDRSKALGIDRRLLRGVHDDPHDAARSERHDDERAAPYVGLGEVVIYPVTDRRVRRHIERHAEDAEHRSTLVGAWKRANYLH